MSNIRVEHRIRREEEILTKLTQDKLFIQEKIELGNKNKEVEQQEKFKQIEKNKIYQQSLKEQIVCIFLLRIFY
jgi:hypothetical protein